MRIELDDPRQDHSVDLLQRHLDFTASVPPGIRHALDVDGLAIPSISFWTVWIGQEPVACAAIKQLNHRSGEIKSMHVIAARRGQGVADRIMVHLIAEARRRGYASLLLETGSTDGYVPARRLYARHGFADCEAFADYAEDPMSTYMALQLAVSVSTPDGLTFRLDDPASDHARNVLKAHLAHSYASSPAESVFALDASGLSAPDIEFWTVWRGDDCVGCGAIRQGTDKQFELKSMHTVASQRGSGVGAATLDFLIDTARGQDGQTVLLETGSMESYAAARRMYLRRGFTERGPFANYLEDPHSTFMELQLNP